MPARPSVSAMSAMTPGRLGTATRSSLRGPRPQPGLDQRAPPGGGPLLPARQVGAGAQLRADRLELGDGAVERVGQRVAVGRVDAAPQAGVGAGDARRVAEARAGGRRALAAERVERLGHEDVGHDVRQVADGGHHAVVDVGVDDGGPRAEPGEQPVQALEQRALGRRGRGQVPGGAVEEVLARVLDAGRLRARQRVAADEARVARGVDDRALGRADVGDDARCAAPARGPWPRCRPARRPGTATKTASAPSSASPRSRWALWIAPRATASSARGSNPRTVAPRRERAARPTDPPMSPTPTTATIKRRRRRPCPRPRPPPARAPRRRRSPRCAAPAARRRWRSRGRGAPRR